MAAVSPTPFPAHAGTLDDVLDLFHPTASLLLMRPLIFYSIFEWGNRELKEHLEPLAYGYFFVLNGYTIFTVWQWIPGLRGLNNNLQGVVRYGGEVVKVAE
jgi:hypothetical protein